MARLRFALAAPLVLLTATYACGGGNDTSGSGGETPGDALCKDVADYATMCGASTGKCDQALVDDCANIVDLLSAPFLDAVTKCLGAHAGASPSACFAEALAGLKPAGSQANLVKTICKTCTDVPLAPSSLESDCESSFIEGVDVPQVGHVNVGALFAVVGDKLATALANECVNSITDCVPQTFATCAEKVLIEQGFPKNTAECFLASILDGGGGVSLGSCGGGSGGGGGGGAGGAGGGTTSTSSSASTGTGGGGATKEVCLNSVVDVSGLAPMGGDADFNGNGPKVDIAIDLARTSTTIAVRSCVTMTETQSDFTKGMKCVTRSFPADNAGFVTQTSNTISYTDTDTSDDDAIAEASSSNFDPALITSVTCQGDHHGNDICNMSTCSHCTITLGCVTILAP